MQLYEQYKKNTSTYVTWVIETATKTGWSGSIYYNDRGQITTATILNASNYIGSQTDFITVLPIEVWRSFRGAVRLRKAFVSRHAEKPGDEEAKAGHDAFILVLEQSASRIRNSVKVSTVCSSEVRPGNFDDTLLTLSNAFDLLNVQNDDHSILDSKPEDNMDATTAQVALKHTTTLSYSPEGDIEEERHLRKFCYMKDVEACLINLDEISKNRMAGRVDLMTATIQINATIGYIDIGEKELEQDGMTVDPADLLYNHCEHGGLRQMFESLLDIDKLQRKGFPLQLQYLADRRTTQPTDDSVPTVDQAWVRKELHLVEVLQELYLEMNVRRHAWEKKTARPRGHKQPISPSSLDQGSRVLESLLNGDSPRVVTAFVAEFIVSTAIHDPDQAGAPLAELLKAARHTSESIHRATEANVQFPPGQQKAVDECLSLLDYILHWPLKEHKYIHLRSLPQKHPYSGMHRAVERHIDLTAENKTRLLNHMPVVAMPDHAPNKDRVSAWKDLYYSPSEDPDFLRERNPAFTGTLLISLMVKREEAGLALAHNSPSLFSLCHVYNALRQTGELTGDKFKWPLLESINEMHKKSLFLGVLPTNPEAIYHRLLLAAGADTKMVTQAKKLRAQHIDPSNSEIFKKSKNRTWDLAPSPMALIYRDHLDGKDGVTFMQTLSKLNIQMQTDSGKLRKKEILTLEERERTSFLDDLEEHLPKLWEHLDLDIIDLTRISSELFAKMASSMLAVSGGPQGSLENCELAIAMSVLGELEDAEVIRNAQKSGPQATANIKTEYTKIARTVLGVHILKEQK